MSHEHEENGQTLISELSERIVNGVVKENPTFVLLLGMCPTLAVTTCAKNGLGMGVTTMVVLALSNLFISLLRKVIPSKIRIPAFIVIIASFVTIVELLLEAYLPSLYEALGLYIPLIVVNCIILGRAEAYAYSHSPLPSLFDGLGMGMGFTFALTLIGAFRELLGAGTLFSVTVMPKSYTPISIFIMAPGAFFVLAGLTAIQNKVKEVGEKKGKDMSKIQSGCGGNCMDCTKECKVTFSDENTKASNEEPVLNKTEEALKEPDTKDKESLVKNEKTETDEGKVTEETGKNFETESEPNSEENTSKEDNASKEENASKDGNTQKDENPSTVQKLKEAKAPSSLDDGIELLDITDYKKAIKNTSSQGKPKRKKASLEKAQAMLNKAEENMRAEKEEKND